MHWRHHGDKPSDDLHISDYRDAGLRSVRAFLAVANSLVCQPSIESYPQLSLGRAVTPIRRTSTDWAPRLQPPWASRFALTPWCLVRVTQALRPIPVQITSWLSRQLFFRLIATRLPTSSAGIVVSDQRIWRECRRWGSVRAFAHSTGEFPTGSFPAPTYCAGSCRTIPVCTLRYGTRGWRSHLHVQHGRWSSQSGIDQFILRRWVAVMNRNRAR